MKAIHEKTQEKVSLVETETISMDDFAKLLGVSRGTIVSMEKDKAKDFPKPVPLGLRNKRYRKEEAKAYAKHGVHWRVKMALG